jgi:hypothetical protein
MGSNSRSDTSDDRATGAMSESFRQYLNNIPGKYVVELQQTAMLSAAHILRELQNVF